MTPHRSEATGNAKMMAQHHSWRVGNLERKREQRAAGKVSPGSTLLLTSFTVLKRIVYWC